jgi:cobalt-zinc-cadmium resistance protein CzcA
VHLPYDSHLEWAGEINQLKEAEDRLKVILPITLLLIAFLVYSAVKNWVDTLIVFVNIPVATAGGVLALLITGITSRCRRRWASSRSSASRCRTRSSW